MKKVTKKVKKKTVKKYEHHPDHDNKSETYLIASMDEDLKEAWVKIRKYGASLGALWSNRHFNHPYTDRERTLPNGGSHF